MRLGRWFAFSQRTVALARGLAVGQLGGRQRKGERGCVCVRVVVGVVV